MEHKLDIHILGCGGVGIWMCLLFAKSHEMFGDRKISLTLQDGDTVEKRNLDRQFFTLKNIGQNKAKALARADWLKNCPFPVGTITKYLSTSNQADLINHPSRNLIIISATDNYPARTTALDIVDQRMPGSTLLISPANGYETAEAFVYKREWQGDKQKDPRVRFPEYLKDKSDDPLAPPCTGEEALSKHPQLALYNMLGASHAAQLMYFWVAKADSMVDSLAEKDPLRKQLINTFPLRIETCPGLTTQENLAL